MMKTQINFDTILSYFIRRKKISLGSVWIEQQALSPYWYCCHLIGDLDRMMHAVFKKGKIFTNRSIFGIWNKWSCNFVGCANLVLLCTFFLYQIFFISQSHDFGHKANATRHTFGPYTSARPFSKLIKIRIFCLKKNWKTWWKIRIGFLYR